MQKRRLDCCAQVFFVNSDTTVVPLAPVRVPGSIADYIRGMLDGDLDASAIPQASIVMSPSMGELHCERRHSYTNVLSWPAMPDITRCGISMKTLANKLTLARAMPETADGVAAG